MRTLDKLRCWLLRQLFNAVTRPIDYSIKQGDIVTSQYYSLATLEIVDVNWALRSVAVRLGPQGAIVVWPVWGLKKVNA